jgi:DNA damage-binding protein 1
MVSYGLPQIIFVALTEGGAILDTWLCYSSVNLSASEDDEMDDNITRPPSHQTMAVNVASPSYSPLLFDTATTTASGTAAASQHYFLCIADKTSLRLGVIDDIQFKNCILVMAPCRIVHCAN